MILKNFFNILKVNILQIVGITFIVWSLIFFLNVLIWISYYFSNFSQEVKNKLGIYLYLKDKLPNSEERPLAKAIEFMNKLKQNWLKVEYYPKEKALKLFQRSIPEVVKAFKKYWIDNPLPDTIYIVVSNQKQYEFLKKTVKDYKDIILNFEDVNQWESFVKQQKRIQNIIEMLNFLTGFSVFLIWIVVVIIVFLLMLVIKLNFYNFYKQIEVEKLLWAFYWQIQLPFILKAGVILCFSFILSLIFSFILVYFLQSYFLKIFSIDLFAAIKENRILFSQLFFAEVIVLFVLVFVFSYIILLRMIKRV